MTSFSCLVDADVLAAGDVAPNWMLPGLDGQQVSLYQEAERGNTTVMVFWATWCRSCRQLLPEIHKLKASLGAEPIRFYALNIWEDGDPIAYIDGKRLDVDVILKADEVAGRFDMKGTPAVIVVGPDKRIKYIRRTGAMPDEILADLRDTLDLEPMTQPEESPNPATP